jgi:hypothetical protein
MKPAKWYDFVPLPNGKKSTPDSAALTHAEHVAGRYSGYLDLVITTLAPVHIGSGAYELSEDADLERGTVVKGMMRLTRRPVIPSSSLKGALRSVYETITFSCIGKCRGFAQERYHRDIKKSELPQALIDDMPDNLQRLAEDIFKKPPKVDIRLDTEELKALKQCRLRKGQGDLSILCPTCSLFGVENFQGRLSFNDAEVCKLPDESKKSVRIPSLYGPRLHRLGEPMVVPGGRRPFVQVSNLKGRKAYYEIRLGDVPAEGQVLIDYLPCGTKLSTQLHFLNVTLAELGGLITALGLDPECTFPSRIGGGKPVGLGYIAFELNGIHILSSETTFIEFNTQFTEEVAAKTCLQTFRESEGKLFYRQGLEKLCEITARPYVPADEEMT